ncbi:hypothetical protein AKO1_009266 [Acrasis kona]|uniref:Selenide, water dikinase n=1 Tax=Acrasis kona TaxID=1008807 RepID=A0AAW2ZK72_9EUKA
MLTVCSHKFYGPKGIGALFVRSDLGIKLFKQIHGAAHERDHRAGTENILNIVGLASACELSNTELQQRIDSTSHLRDLIVNVFREKLDQRSYVINGHPQYKLPNTLNISFVNVEANTLLDEIGSKVAASAGAACHSGDVLMSHVLEAIKLPVNVAMGTIRLSTGMFLTEEDAKEAAHVIADAVLRLAPSTLIDEPSINHDDDAIDNIRLTTTTHGLGCGCKIRPQTLERILRSLRPYKTQNSHNVLVGTETSDDAAVVRIRDDLAIVTTLDFFTPIVDDAFEFGYIAANNALSDIYAMGGTPISCLNIVCFPIRRLPLKVLERVLSGAQKCCSESGVDIVGGHSVDDNELKFGMSVTGSIHPNQIWRNTGGRLGDAIILTKPIGVGIITTAIKTGLAKSDDPIGFTARRIMMESNGNSSKLLQKYSVHACTDVTGFGLIGHMKEMLNGQDDLSIQITYSSVPFIDGLKDLVQLGAVPGGTINNMDYVSQYVSYSKHVTESMKIMLNDAQTSGGLCVAVPFEQYEAIKRELPFVELIGRIVERNVNKIMIV